MVNGYEIQVQFIPLSPWERDGVEGAICFDFSVNQNRQQPSLNLIKTEELISNLYPLIQSSRTFDSDGIPFLISQAPA